MNSPHTLKVGEHDQLFTAGHMAGAAPSATNRDYKKAVRTGSNTFFVPNEDADPRYKITRVDGRFHVVLEYSDSCPRCQITCLFKNKSDPIEKLDLEYAVRDFFLDFEWRLRIHLAHAFVSEPDLTERSATALIIGAPLDVVDRLVRRKAGENFKAGFAVVVKPGDA